MQNFTHLGRYSHSHTYPFSHSKPLFSTTNKRRRTHFHWKNVSRPPYLAALLSAANVGLCYIFLGRIAKGWKTRFTFNIKPAFKRVNSCTLKTLFNPSPSRNDWCNKFELLRIQFFCKKMTIWWQRPVDLFCLVQSMLWICALRFLRFPSNYCLMSLLSSSSVVGWREGFFYQWSSSSSSACTAFPPLLLHDLPWPWELQELQECTQHRSSSSSSLCKACTKIKA